jgi:hypothetical protein
MRAMLVPAAGEWPAYERAQVDASMPSPSPHKFRMPPKRDAPLVVRRKDEGGKQPRVGKDAMERIAREEAEAGQITLEMILGPGRRRCEVRPRQLAMWRCVRELGASVTSVGRYFGDRDHTTVVFAVHKMDAELHADPV